MFIKRSALLATVACTTHAIGCPELNRYPANTGDGQLSIFGGGVPDGHRVADDFRLPAGNSWMWNVRVLKFTIISNFALTSSNVTITFYADILPVGSLTDAQPGSAVAGPPNSPPTVRDLGPWFGTAADGRPMRIYEVAYSIPNGFLQLQPNRWYWVSPMAYGSAPAAGHVDVAYVALGSDPPLVGQPAFASNGTPGTGAFTTWTSTAPCCAGAHDLALYLDAVQVGTAFADFNCDLGLNVGDIFDFLAAWFAGSASGDFNGRDGANVTDIFDFLNTWFAGA